MQSSILPKLDFPMIKYGTRETPWSLLPLLYSGGAKTNSAKFSNLLKQDTLGPPIINRLSLVNKIHEYFEEKLISGSSKNSVGITIKRLREFISWADSNEKSISLATIEEIYIEWTDYLIHQQRVTGSISEMHAYQIAVAVGKVLTAALDLKHGLITKTRIRKTRRNKSALAPSTDKQNLEQTFIFGQALLDITNSLSRESIQGTIPVIIKFRSGLVIEEWTKLRPPEKLKLLQDNTKPSDKKKSLAQRAAWIEDTSFKTRSTLINLRIESEMLIFIAQTGINLEQAYALKFSKFRYQSHQDGYHVYRVYKGRRLGEVAFDIFSEYRKLFECYLEWRNFFFSSNEDDLLFPFITVRTTSPPKFTAVKKYCSILNIKFISSRTLRKTRINWFLRKSKDPEITAEMHAHSQKTLIEIYEQPSLQIAAIEITRFHAKTDPSLLPPGPGICINPEPITLLNSPSNAAIPDCISPAGCLFCSHQRDVDTEDHIWSLASYRHLKSLELARYRPAVGFNMEQNPATIVIERITEKLKYFEQSNNTQEIWVKNSQIRIEESDYHPLWGYLIMLIESR